MKSADLYLWMGDGGQRDYTSFEGNDVWICDVGTGEKERVGKVTFWKSGDPYPGIRAQHTPHGSASITPLLQQ